MTVIIDRVNITIPIEPVSKKNSQQIMINSKTKKPFISPSSKYIQYERMCMLWLMKYRYQIDFAVNIKYLFYMGSRRRCDLTNLIEAADDVLVKARVILDDNYNIVAGHDGSRVLYDKENPRTEIEITIMELHETKPNKAIEKIFEGMERLYKDFEGGNHA